MTFDEARTLFAYDRWANRRLLAILGALPADRLEATVESSFPSLLATFGHMVGAEWVWLRRWQGEPPGAFPEWLRQPSFADLHARLERLDDERDAFLAGLDEADLDRELDYRTLDGTPHRTRLGDLVFHVVNHASYHRGQLTTMLRQLGATTVSTDLVVYLRERG
jgi:uncharacterized damage-inducible protein DinB